MDDLKILQVVGYKNSGKTTLIKSWIKQLNEQNITTSVIKHHGHGTPLDLPNTRRDSMQFLEAGAVGSIVADQSMLQLHQKIGGLELDQLVQYAKLAGPRVIFIEGYKNENYPKVVLLRNSEDWDTLRHLSNVVRVMIHEGFETDVKKYVRLSDSSAVCAWLNEWIEEGAE